MNDIFTAIHLGGHIAKAIEKPISELRTNILTNEKAGKSILFISTCQEEGKSTVSLSLALSLSRCEKRVVWLNCDLHRKNRMVSVCEDERTADSLCGLADYLVDKKTIDEIIYKVVDEQLHIIPSGSLQKKANDLLESERFQTLVTELGESYDYIIIDSSTTSEYVDSRIVASKCDSIVYVIRQGHTKLRKINLALNALKKCNPNVLGAVLNQTKK